jgi:Transposase IS66 family
MKRGLASPLAHSALATTRRGRLQLLVLVVHLQSLKRRSGLAAAAALRLGAPQFGLDLGNQARILGHTQHVVHAVRLAPCHQFVAGKPAVAAHQNAHLRPLQAKLGDDASQFLDRTLNRQAERYAKEGVPLSLSTLADQVGGCTAALMPLFKRLEAHALSAQRLHGDDTTVSVLAKGKTITGRIWVYVRDDQPFAGQAPPGAVFYYSRDRAGEHPQAHLANYSGIFQADAYGGYGKLYGLSG